MRGKIFLMRGKKRLVQREYEYFKGSPQYHKLVDHFATINTIMRLKIAISFIESTYQVLGFLALVCIAGSFFWLKGTALALTIIISLGVLIAVFFLKVKLINIYLRRCKYPNEFLSVLDQLKLMDDIQINWSNDGVRNSNDLTDQFLKDNNLATEIGKKKASIPFAITMVIFSTGGLVYFSQKDLNGGKELLMGLLTVSLLMSFYLLARGRKQQNDNEPILIFNRQGFFFDDIKIQWDKIRFWKYKDGHNDSKGYIVINYESANNSNEELNANLDDLNIDRIDFLLLLTHFKAKYANDQAIGISHSI
jgi:hypothetical protein